MFPILGGQNRSRDSPGPASHPSQTLSDPSQTLSDPCQILSNPSQNRVGSETKSPIGSGSKIQIFLKVSESIWGARNRSISLIPSLIPPAQRRTCGVRAQWGPVTDKTWAIGNLRKKIAQAKIFLKLPISSGLSVSMLSDPGIHPQGSCLGGLIGSFRA